MNRKVSWPAVTAALVLVTGLLAASAAAAQGKYRGRANDGPYRVVLSKPIADLGYTAGTLHREHEYLSAMLNELDRDGLVPVFTNVTNEQRLLVVCRLK